MELELKHLAPYLNYDLQFEGGHWMIGLSNLKRDNYNIHDQRMILCSDKKQGVQTWECFPEIVKPLLRPLSDLTKEKLEYFNFVSAPKITDDVGQYSYEFAVYCFENHYDLFFLIEAGLAIDLNTINK